jgi:putative hemolysin
VFLPLPTNQQILRRNALKSLRCSVIAVAAVAASFLSASAQTKNAKPHSQAKSHPAQDYCVKTGGVVEARRPYYGTNGNDPLQLKGKRLFCQYTAEDGSRIHVLQETLYSTKPSLAALAYYAQVQLGDCQGNPASCYCTQLGGSDLFGGIDAAGGGWVLKGAEDEVLEACIFPDMSSIDSWGLAYHSVGVIRGIDLGTVLRYKNPN